MTRKRLCQIPVVLALIGLLVPGQFVADARVQPPQVGLSPTLVEAVSVPSEGMVIVRGQQFTPGGQVYVALYDRWGVQRFETRWVSASEELWGMNGSRDPALGYVHGGSVIERFSLSDEAFGPNGSRDPALIDVPDDPGGDLMARSCTTMLMVRALDVEQNVWTNTIDAEMGC
jgi:hypothetical protein